MPPSFAIAQVSPFPWEDDHDVNEFVRKLSEELAQRGHRMLVLAPSRSPEHVRDSRRLIRAAAEDPFALFDGNGGVRVLGVGELLPMAPTRRAIAPWPPVDIGRTIEEVLSVAPLDFVHLHEPFAPSASSVALRYSQALNVGSFHAPTERILSTQVARRFVELFFGRLDARTASFVATAELMKRFFPADYRVVMPGADVLPRSKQDRDVVEVGFIAREERAATRFFIRALRQLPTDLDWNAKIYVPKRRPTPSIPATLRDRVEVLLGSEHSEDEFLRGVDLVVFGSTGQSPAPGVLARAIGNGAVPLAAGLAPYEEILRDGDFGLLFKPGDLTTLTTQLARLIAEPKLRASFDLAGAADQLSWTRVADEFEAVYSELAARRHDARGNSSVRAQVRKRRLIDVDLHMHTDHSYDCATPVEVLLAAARDQGLGAIAVTDHNEISGALEAREKSEAFGVKVIVAEEVKTANQGEVIGLFIEEKIPRGMSLDETIAAIRAQGGLVYVPHPFDRLHSVPDYEHLLDIVGDIDALEIFNPRVAITAFNDEAVRFAAKYRIVAGAGSDSHVAQGLGSVRIRMHDFDGPEEFLESLRDADIIRKPSSLLYVQALKFLQTKATPSAAREAARVRRVRKAVRNQASKR